MSNRFMNVPLIRKPRSVFNLNQTHKTAFNVGDLIPFYVQEVYPGDGFQIKTDFVARLNSSFIKVPFDNLFLDTYYFFVANRIVDKNFTAVIGENSESEWAPKKAYTVPTVSLKGATGSNTVGSIADYLGIPTTTTTAFANIKISQYPFRAFAKIWNDWFRNENTQSPVLIDVADNVSLDARPWAPDSIFGMPPKVSKFHDYFTSCLPAPQKGDPVDVPVLGNNNVLLPVNATSFDHSIGDSGIKYVNQDTGLPFDQSKGVVAFSDGTIKGVGNPDLSGSASNIAFNNLWAVADGVDLGSFMFNDLRYAGALQRMLERDARAGTRYTELLQSHFGVISPDARLQRSEYLGGNRQPLNVTQVAQTSAGSEQSPQANLASFSQTIGRSRATKSFTEHGFVIGVACIRQKHTYQYGVERFWTRLDRYDFYDPVFANIGEQPVYQYEIYAYGDAKPDKVFGYQEAWADLRYKPDRISGVMRSTSPETLDIWHFGDKYANAPVLNDSFLNETPEYVDRTISVPSTQSPQFLVDFYIQNRASRVLPTYSVPGLVDHN